MYGEGNPNVWISFDIQTKKISKPFSESSGFTSHTKQKRFGYFLLYRKVLLSENLGTKIARSKAGIVNQTVWIKRCKSPLHQNRHHQGYQIHVRNNPYPEVRRHSCHGLL